MTGVVRFDLLHLWLGKRPVREALAPCVVVDGPLAANVIGETFEDLAQICILAVNALLQRAEPAPVRHPAWGNPEVSCGLLERHPGCRLDEVRREAPAERGVAFASVEGLRRHVQPAVWKPLWNGIWSVTSLADEVRSWQRSLRGEGPGEPLVECLVEFVSEQR